MTRQEHLDLEAAEKHAIDFANILPGQFDVSEAIKCFKAGIAFERKRAAGEIEKFRSSLEIAFDALSDYSVVEAMSQKIGSQAADAMEAIDKIMDRKDPP